MATTQEARQQLQAQQQQITRAREQIQEARLRDLTRAELQRRTREDLARRQQQQQSLGRQKEAALESLKPAEEELRAFQKEIEGVEKRNEQIRRQNAAVAKERRDWETAKKFIERGKEVAAKGDPSVTSKINQLKRMGVMSIKGLAEARQAEQLQRSLEAVKVEPVSPFLSTIEVAPSLSQQFKTEIQKATPEIPLNIIPVENILEKAIGLGVGTKNFIVEEFRGELTDLKDVKGQRIFTPKQASGVTDLAEEVVVSYILGRGVGKGATLIRGGVSKLVPTALQGSKKFQRVVSAIEFAGGTALTAAATKSIADTYRKQGEKAALLQMIGLASFGVGFSKAGFKPSSVAQKDFDRFATNLKTTIPKGKRGAKQVLVQRIKRAKKEKKKKDKEKTKKEKKELTERQIEVLSAIEKRLLNAKTLKEQLQILAEIRSKLKDPIAIANFEEFVLKLIEKKILKLPTFVITGKVKNGVRLPTKAQVKKQLTVKIPKKELTLVKQIQKQKLKIAADRKQSIRNLQIQRTKLLTLQKQRSSQASINKQASVLKSLQKTIQKQRSKQKLKLLTLQAQVAKQITKRGIKTRPKITRKPKRVKPKIVAPLAIPILPKGVEETKLVKALLALKKQGVNVVTGINVGKRRTIAKNLPPFKALKLARKFVDSNIQASFKLVPSGKTTKKKDIKPFNIGRKFRPSKKDVLFVVEKRKFRLDFPREVSQLKSFKGKVPIGFFPKTKKKRGRKKK
jgi:hypothetical protein